jgi:hypothetical protein
MVLMVYRGIMRRDTQRFGKALFRIGKIIKDLTMINRGGEAQLAPCSHVMIWASRNGILSYVLTALS